MSTDPFVAQLISICQSAGTSAKWVIVPSHGIGRTLGERLALAGQDWVNLRFATPFSLALQAAAPHLLERGLDPLPEGLGPSLVMRLLMEQPASIPSYFRPLADQPRMGAALWAAICELRLTGISSATLPSAAFEDERKHAELLALLAAYEQHLAENRLADAADVYRAATAHAAEVPIGPHDFVIEAAELGNVLPLVRAFLAALPGQKVEGAWPQVPGLEIPRRLTGLAKADFHVPAGESKLAYLLAPSEAPEATRTQHIELFHAAGREAEVEAVLRRVLNATPAIPLDQVEVACAGGEGAALLWEKAQRLDLPVTLEGGIPIVVTRPARALLGLCDWIDSNFIANRLRRLLQSGDVRVEFPDGAGGARAARLLSKSAATWGRDTYRQAFAALAAQARAAAEDDEEREEEERKTLRAKAEQAEFLGGWICEVLGRIPAPGGDGHVVLAEVVRGLSSVVDDTAAIAGPLDAAGLGAIREALDRLLALGGFRCAMRQALALVRDAVERLGVGASRARPGHLHVSSLASAGYAGRPVTFIIGLEEGAVFPSLLEDPVLLDAERCKISGALATSHDRLAESVYTVVSRMAVLPLSGLLGEDATPSPVMRLCLSSSCRDLRDGRETAPSWLMLQAMRLEQGKPDLTYEQLREALGTPETLVAPRPKDGLSDAGWWLASLKQAGPQGADAVFQAFPSLANGREAAAARASDDFTEWDGFVPAARALLDPRVSGQAVSVTRLEQLVRCPYRYFIEHGLGLEVTDDDPDRDEWLDALQRGSVLHEIFATLCREARAKERRLDPRKDAFRARQLADERLAVLRQQCPPPSEIVFDRERTDLLRDVDLFIDFESRRGTSEPIAFEVAFGHDDGGEEPLARREPIEISLGKGERFLLKGTIDRIDRLPGGTYEVIDYKTGKYDRAKWQGTFGGGSMLQHALYGVAATVLLRRLEAKPRVERGVYEFPSAKGGGERVEKPPVSQAALVGVLSDLFDVMACGGFVPTDQKKECEWCDFSEACGMPWEQARAKLENDENETLDAYRRLQRHE